MKRKKICISKKLVIYSLLFLSVFLIIIISSRSLSTKKTVSSQAAPKKIIGGENVEVGEYPYVAYIWPGFTGTLIHPQWILTCAHGLKEETLRGYASAANNPDDYRIPNNSKSIYPNVAIGIIDRDEYTYGIESTRIKTILKVFYDNESYDLALLKLEKPVDIKIPNINYDYDANDYNAKFYTYGNSVTAVGWGCKSDDQIAEYPNLLQKVNLEIKDMTWGWTFPKDKKFGLESYWRDKRACNGDSGGPVFYQHQGALYIIGVITNGDEIFGDGITIAVKINDEVINWINNTISVNTEPTPTPRKIISRLTPTPTLTRCGIYNGEEQYCREIFGCAWCQQTNTCLDYSTEVAYYACSDNCFPIGTSNEVACPPTPTP